MNNLLRIEGLSVSYRSPFSKVNPVHAVQNFDLTLDRGEVVGVAGESGSGKSTALLSATGYNSPAAIVTSGSSTLGGVDLLRATREQLRGIWGRKIGFVAQNAGLALHPSLTIGEQLADAKRAHAGGRRTDWRGCDEFHSLLEAVEIPAPRQSLQKFAYEFSGGQQQRIAIALALVGSPDVIFLDEPTTGLDVTTQARISELLLRLVQTRGLGLVYVSHDLGLLSKITDRLIIMRHGRIVEVGSTRRVLIDPDSDYARKLIDSVPDIAGHLQFRTGDAKASKPEPAIQASNLSIAYGRKRVVDNVDLAIHEGEILCLVGESGSGKSTILKAFTGLQSSVIGEMRLEGATLARSVAERDRETIRRVQTVFQNPDSALNPRRTIAAILERPLVRYRPELTAGQRLAAVHQVLRQVELPSDVASRFCGELSGGQRQRVALARAIIVEPDVLLCDEVTSALDVSVQASVLETLVRLVSERNLAVLFVTHDLGVVRAIADRVVVLKGGKIVEHGPVREIFASPVHPYTRQLLAAVPVLLGRSVSTGETGNSRELRQTVLND